MTSISYEISFLKALIVTLIIESLILLLILNFSHFRNLKKFGTRNLILVCLLATACTLPYLWFVIPAFIKIPTMYHVFGESLVVLLEFCIYALFIKTAYKKLFLLSFLCNLGSYLIGLLLNI